MSRVIIGIALAILAASSLTARAQILGPGLERHRLEAGYTFKWFERDFESRFVGREDWSAGALYLRYGVCRWATLSFEGGIWNIDDGDFAGMDYRRYTFGGGLNAKFWEHDGWRVEAAWHYSEIFDHDRSPNQLEKNLRNITALLQVERSFALRSHAVTLWLGPALVYDQSRQFPWRSTEPMKDNTSNNFGFAFGTNAVFFDRVNLFAHSVYADAFQPRLGAALRF